jgi:curved DNA-binding protein CbpA
MTSGIVDMAGRRMDIEMQAALVDAQDHYELLGVPRTATHEEIQRAYFALAKLWHPDRQPPELLDLREKIARVFSRVNEAYQTLTDATRRMEYLRALEVGTATVEDQQRLVRAVDAALECQKADVLLRKNDLVAAEGYARRAVAADPDQPEFLTVLTWIQAQRRGEPPQLVDGQTSSHYDDLIRILDGVLSKEPEFERALFYRGMLLKRSGRGDIGIRDLRKAAELNPRNIDAVREVRLWNMRKRVGGDADKTGPHSRRTSSPRSPATRPSKSPPKGQPSIFQKIFKK